MEPPLQSFVAARAAVYAWCRHQGRGFDLAIGAATGQVADGSGLLEGAAGLAASVLWPSGAPEHAPPSAEPAAVLHGLFWLVSNLAERDPLVLVVDDAQWADRPSLRFLAYLARRLSGLALLLVVAM